MEKIAIVGLSCLFPDAQTPEQFWQNLIAGKDSVSLATEEQMGVNPDIFYDPVIGKTAETAKYYCKRGGYIKNFQFEPTGYNIAPDVLEGLDAIYQWSLYVAKQALQDSGYLGNTAILSKSGVILGNLSAPTRFSYRLIPRIYQRTIESTIQELLDRQDFRLESLPSPDNLSPLNFLTAGYPSAVIAHALSLSGINFSLDAACASSLYAVKLACNQLISRKADLMLAGGISCTDPFMTHTAFSLFQAYPNDGESSSSRPLDKSSKGLMTAEGAGMVVLKRHSDAIRDGDKIYATILGGGLSNDGRGKYFLSPNPKGQILAFERAYTEAGINPQSIAYVECHATGTPVGDPTELNSMEAFFGQYGASPLVGSVKSNLGHLLTAAGMPSLIKVILSMYHGLIPPTIHVNEPFSSNNNVIAAENVVKAAIPWPESNTPKRAGVSSFGFGGTNSHLILEEGSQQILRQSAETESREHLQPEKMAIVGMDAFFGSSKSLDAFERCIYEGNQSFIPIPHHRWQGIEDRQQLLKDYDISNTEVLKGAYIKDFEMDYLHFRIPPDKDDQPIPQQLLILNVADKAIRDAGLEPGANVAVLVAMGTELANHKVRTGCDLRHWQIRESLAKSNIVLPPEKIPDLEKIASDSLIELVKVNQCMSFIGNIMASRISSLWDFSGPSFTISAEENSTFKALETAQMLLVDKQVDAVVVGAVDLAGGVENVLLRHKLANVNSGVPTLSFDRNANGWNIGEGAGVVVLKRLDRAKQTPDRIYAVIDSIDLVQENSLSDKTDRLPQQPKASAIAQVCQKSFERAGIRPEDVGYLEVFGSGAAREDEAEMMGLLQAYQMSHPELRCALGSIKANIGHTYAASGMASLIKTALCLYHRYIPATPRWSGPKNLQAWQNSPFYVATDSRPWSLEATAAKRFAAINGLGIDRTYAHLILSEDTSEKDRRSQYLEQTPFYLFPIAANESSALLEQLEELQQTIAGSDRLDVAASQVFRIFQQHPQAEYALAIVGRSKDELIREIQRAINGVAKAFAEGGAWKTPLGSYFAARPLGKQGNVAFVYPGGFTSYLGMGRDLYHLFPNIYDRAARLANDRPLKELLHSSNQLIYPRSLERLSKRQLESLDMQLADDVTGIPLSSALTALGHTLILKDYFRLQPKSAFGYSTGEYSMMFALNVWPNADDVTNNANASPLFKNRISGSHNAVREYWGLPPSHEPSGKDFWGTYVLMSSPAEVKELLKHEDRVYLTIINTPQEVVIAGDPQGCLRVIRKLKCNYFPAPFRHVIHCEAMSSEYDELVKILQVASQPVPQIDFYSSADYTCIPLNSQAIAHNIAKALCHPLDFPRLIDQVYQDGARVFIEVGPGGTCSRWIRGTLEQKEHVVMSVNSRGIDDHTSLIRVLAQLVSHRVPVELSPLYSQSEIKLSKKKSLIQTVTLGNERIDSLILTEENRQKFPPLLASVRGQSNLETPELIAVKSSMRQDVEKAIAETSSTRGSAQGQTRSREVHVRDLPDGYSSTVSSQHSTNRIESSPNISRKELPVFSSSNQAFLQARREGLWQMSEMIQQQIAVCQKMLNTQTVGERLSTNNLGDRSSALEASKATTSANKQSSELQEPSIPSKLTYSTVPRKQPDRIVFDEADVLEFARGKISRVFGKEYEIIDSYQKRMRLPLPPYLFVSRVTKLDAQRGCFEPCSIETEYDIPDDPWYSVDGQLPGVVALEASHSNIFLASYLGIELETNGQRVYRNLGGTTTFLSHSPQAGETLRCTVKVNSFTRSGDALLFFFTYECFVGERKFLTMESGGGLFSEADLNKKQGITLTDLEKKQRSKIQRRQFKPLLHCQKSSFDEEAIAQLRAGNFAACFGANYEQHGRNISLRFPPLPISTIDRVTSIDPQGGPWGLGFLVAEKTLDPKQWYFNCHFKDDFCLPGALITEGCTQLLGIYILYLGLQTHTTDARLQPLTNFLQTGRYRGQILPISATLTYQLEVTEIGLTPRPFIKANAMVIFEGKIIAMIANLGLQLSEKIS
jgi:PfaB family protein